MKNFKKSVSMILCLLLLLGNIVYADEIMPISASLAKDYEGHWAQATIEKWLNEGRVSGYPDGSYKPDNKVTRAEFVKMVNGIIDYSKMSDITYKDVAQGQWYYDYVRTAQSIGYISGYSSNEFGPNDYITREQAASILTRIQYLKNNAAGADKFSDKKSLSSWAAEAVGAASEAGFISGYVDGSFQPKRSLTRAEAITMLDNVLVNAKNKVVYNDGTELKDMVIEGDLIIAKTVGDGNVFLTNLEIKGDIQVYGGGINSIYFKNVKVAKIEVLKDKVRLVFEDGSIVEDIEVGTETIIENKDGEIQRITISDKDGVVLSGNLGEVTVSGTDKITLKNAVITRLIVEDKVTIYGKGTVKTLEAKADGITYEAAVKIDKVVVGEGVKTAPEVIKETVVSGGGGGGGVPGGDSNPNIQIIIKTADQDTGIAFNSKTYKESDNDKFKEFLVQELKSILNKDSNIDGYITKINDKIDGISVEGVKLYDEAGWTKAIAYLNGTDIKDDVEELKADLLDDDISKDDINSVLDLYEKYSSEDVDKIVKALEALNDKTIEYNGEKVQYELTFKEQGKDVEITTVSDIAKFVLNKMLNADKTVKEFFDTYGDVVFTASYGDKTTVITIKSVTLQ